MVCLVLHLLHVFLVGLIGLDVARLLAALLGTGLLSFLVLDRHFLQIFTQSKNRWKIVLLEKTIFLVDSPDPSMTIERRLKDAVPKRSLPYQIELVYLVATVRQRMLGDHIVCLNKQFYQLITADGYFYTLACFFIIVIHLTVLRRAAEATDWAPAISRFTAFLTSVAGRGRGE